MQKKVTLIFCRKKGGGRGCLRVGFGEFFHGKLNACRGGGEFFLYYVHGALTSLSLHLNHRALLTTGPLMYKESDLETSLDPGPWDVSASRWLAGRA